DSQDICFIPDGDYAAFIRAYSGKDYPEGDFVDTAGNVLGRHKGIINYTVGQRKGLGIALGEPAYVKDIDVAGNRVVLCRGDELFGNSLNARDFNWVSGKVPKGAVSCVACVRYRGIAREALCTPTGESSVKIDFLKPQRAITRGQAVVLYDGDTVLGGGTIY
ncbi:MAG: tRNA 2-thiouridine(34) synthase MnmA, partial [Clostridia bacterium]|nr:tRNA 2-thiouridine(34) synthase MnmA [Clostridia bacterium]